MPHADEIYQCGLWCWGTLLTDAREWDTAAGFAQGERNWQEQQQRLMAANQEAIDAWLAEHRPWHPRVQADPGSAHGESASGSEEILWGCQSDMTWDPSEEDPWEAAMAQDVGAGVLDHFLTPEHIAEAEAAIAEAALAAAAPSEHHGGRGSSTAYWL